MPEWGVDCQRMASLSRFRSASNARRYTHTSARVARGSVSPMATHHAKVERRPCFAYSSKYIADASLAATARTLRL